jgi:hypothetical protein
VAGVAGSSMEKRKNRYWPQFGTRARFQGGHSRENQQP